MRWETMTCSFSAAWLYPRGVDSLLFRASEKLADLLAPGSESDEMTLEPDEDNSVENGFYYGVGPSEF